MEVKKFNSILKRILSKMKISLLTQLKNQISFNLLTNNHQEEVAHIFLLFLKIKNQQRNLSLEKVLINLNFKYQTSLTSIKTQLAKLTHRTLSLSVLLKILLNLTKEVVEEKWWTL